MEKYIWILTFVLIVQSAILGIVLHKQIIIEERLSLATKTISDMSEEIEPLAYVADNLTHYQRKLAAPDPAHTITPSEFKANSAKNKTGEAVGADEWLAAE